MCGISGFLDDTGRARDSFERLAVRMSDTLRHRGPDDSGAWVDPAAGIALSHRRLSILDLSPEGQQPMRSHDGRYVTVFNGEIYNFQELRAELAARGHTFRGHSDTEVMLAGFCEWGIDAAPPGSTACSPSRSGTAGKAPLPGARPHGQEAPLLRLDRRYFLSSAPS